MLVLRYQGISVSWQQWPMEMRGWGCSLFEGSWNCSFTFVVNEILEGILPFRELHILALKNDAQSLDEQKQVWGGLSIFMSQHTYENREKIYDGRFSFPVWNLMPWIISGGRKM